MRRILLVTLALLIEATGGYTNVRLTRVGENIRAREKEKSINKPPAYIATYAL